MVPAPPVTGRVYTLDRQQSYRALNLVRGIIYVSGYDIDVLFDSGATYSFIAGPIVVGLNLPMSELSPPLRVTTTTRDKCDASSIYQDVAFQLDGRDYLADLFCLSTVNLEIIVGMYCLSKNYKMIDCCAKKVVMSPCDANASSSPYLSVLQTRKALKERAYGYVMLGGLVSRTQEDITSILVVREFIEVFLEEIPKLPPHREIEFSIDLVSSAGPILLAP
ncbi:uncharacterized protein LOC133304886 [Gastrolobium bilobum]|uniref:uncharacterized protein LOC133304886 n=1 Tax=Gastrolobium bilobum TaxID=150636 RepID=UPI002AB0EAE5|nr:uncharacterized protein LOC133304886 [Gastrolobium bilobum]